MPELTSRLQDLLRAIGNFEPSSADRFIGGVAAVGLFGRAASRDRLLEAKLCVAADRVPLRIVLGGLIAGNQGALREWQACELTSVVGSVLARHGLPRPVGLAGRAYELLSCAAAAAVLGVTGLSVAGKRRLAARWRLAASPRSVRRFVVAAAHRVALTLLYRRLLHLAGARGRTSAPEALFDCLVATLAEHLLDAGPLSALPPYVTLNLVVDFDKPAPGRGDGAAAKQPSGIASSFGDFRLAFVGEAITTACFGCYAMRGPYQEWRRLAIFLAHAAASVGAAWSASRLVGPPETTEPRICDADA